MIKGGATPTSGGSGFWCVLDLSWPFAASTAEAEADPPPPLQERPPIHPSSLPLPQPTRQPTRQPMELLSHPPAAEESYTAEHLESLLELSAEEATEFAENLKALTNSEKQETLAAYALAHNNNQAFSASLIALGWEEVPIDADGNCLFRAVSHILYGDQQHHTLIRRAAVKFMAKHTKQCRVTKEVLKQFGGSLHLYLTTLAKDREWGDDSCLRALSLMYQRHAICYIGGGPSGAAQEHPEFQADNHLGLDLLVLANRSGVSHFNACEDASTRAARLVSAPGVVESAWLDGDLEE